MSQAYRLLSEGLPEPPAPAERFAADARKARSWVADLPRANSHATQQKLQPALDSLAGQKLEGPHRLAVLEELRLAVVETIGMLRLQYAGSPLPLPAPKAMAADQVEAFHMSLAHAYRKAAVELCAPAGSIPMLRGGAVLQALGRSAWHYSQALSIGWRIYRAPAVGAWQGLHRIYGFAVEHKIEAKAADDKVAGAPIEIRRLYLQTLLMAIANPLAFSQVEQDSLWPIAHAFAARCSLLRQAPEENAPVVPEDADRGPSRGVIGESYGQWLEMRAFGEEIDLALEQGRDGFSELRPTRGTSVRVPIKMLTRLKRSFGLAAARSHKRLTAGHELRTVIGLSGVHFYLAGQRDFDTFMRQVAQNIVHVVDRASWANVTIDAAHAPVLAAKALDQSLGGYRIAWNDADQVRVRVGELIGITLAESDEEPDWMVGVLRWLRYETGGGLTAGIELLSRRVAAVGLRMCGVDGAPRAPLCSLEMDALDVDGDACFLASGLVDPAPMRIEVVRAETTPDSAGAGSGEGLLAGLDVLLNAGDYAVLRPLRDDLVAEPTQEASLV